MEVSHLLFQCGALPFLHPLCCLYAYNMSLCQTSCFQLPTNAFQAYGEVTALRVLSKDGHLLEDTQMEKVILDTIIQKTTLSSTYFQKHVQLLVSVCDSRKMGYATLPRSHVVNRRTQIRAGVTHVFLCILFSRVQTVVLCGFMSLSALRIANYHIDPRSLLKDKGRLQISSMDTEERPPPTTFPIYDPFAVGYTFVRTRTQELVTWRVRILEALHSSTLSTLFRMSKAQRHDACCCWHRKHFEPYTTAKYADDMASFVLTQSYMYYFSETVRTRYMEAEELLLEIRLSILCTDENSFECIIRNSVGAQCPFVLLNIKKKNTWTDDKGVLHYQIHLPSGPLPGMIYLDALRKRCRRARGGSWVTEDALWDWYNCEYYCVRSAVLPPRIRRHLRQSCVRRETGCGSPGATTVMTIAPFEGDAVDARLDVYDRYARATARNDVHADESMNVQPDTGVRRLYRVAFEYAPSLVNDRSVYIDSGNLYVPWFYAHYGFAARFRHICLTTWQQKVPASVKQAWRKGIISEDKWPVPQERAPWIKRLELEIQGATLSTKKVQYRARKPRYGLPTIDKLESMIPPCMAKIRWLLKTQHRTGYKLRFALTTFLLNLGYRIETIEAYLEAHGDMQHGSKKKQKKRRNTIYKLADTHRKARREKKRTLTVNCGKLATTEYSNICPFVAQQDMGKLGTELASRK